MMVILNNNGYITIIMKKSNGFTLIELMVALVIAAILLTVAVPSFQSNIQRNRMTSAVNSVQGSLLYAKSEAVTKGTTVSICRRNAAGTDCNNAVFWEAGWLVFRDINANGAIDTAAVDPTDCTVQTDDCILKIFDPLKEQLAMGSNGTIVNNITFNLQGFSPLTTGTLTLCDDRGPTEAVGIIVNPSGSLIRAADSNANNIDEDHTGVDLVCP